MAGSAPAWNTVCATTSTTRLTIWLFKLGRLKILKGAYGEFPREIERRAHFLVSSLRYPRAATSSGPEFHTAPLCFETGCTPANWRFNDANCPCRVQSDWIEPVPGGAKKHVHLNR